MMYSTGMRKINGRCDVEQPPSRQPARPATTFGGKYQICCTLDQSSARTREWYLKQPLGAGEQTAGDSLFNRAFQKGFSKGFVTVIRFSNEMHDYASLLYSLVFLVPKFNKITLPMASKYLLVPKFNKFWKTNISNSNFKIR